MSKWKIKPDAVIFDLDATLCDDAHRAHLLEEEDNYHAYNSKLAGDRPIQSVLNLLNFAKSEGKQIVILTGRSEAFFDATEVWLYHNVNLRPSDYKLFMRPIGDHRPNALHKQSVYEREIKPNYIVNFAIDDNESVVEMWKQLGLKTLRVLSGEILE